MKVISAFAGFIFFFLCCGIVAAQPLDISDRAIERFLAFPFQYDYTGVRDDSTLRGLIDAVDTQMAIIEYRSLKEIIALPGDTLIRRDFSEGLQRRRGEIMDDNFLFKVLADWKTKSADTINRAAIVTLSEEREDMVVDPSALLDARQLAERIADRLYGFRFQLDGVTYRPNEVAEYLEDGSDPERARKLYAMQNDSARQLVADASRLYDMYSRMGEFKGYRTTLDHTLSRISMRRPEWFKIAEEMKKYTDGQYDDFLALLAKETGNDNPTTYEIEVFLRDGDMLPDSLFPREKVDAAVRELFTGAGLGDVYQQLDIETIENSSWPALAIKLYPPYDNYMVSSGSGGFEYYRRMVAETARSLMWVFADSALPYILRDYPNGAGEVLTQLFEEQALRPEFLMRHFSMDKKMANRFARYHTYYNIFRLRSILMFFFFDYYLSDGSAKNPAELFHTLEESLLKVKDHSQQWIESLITGNMEKYPKWLAHLFGRIKLEEMLYTRFGKKFLSDTRSGDFIIDRFCRPGRTQTLEGFVSSNSGDRLSVEDMKRQMAIP